ncbi:MAG: glycoside hydrolase family 127 protein [Acidimicrobiia bacterium]|nr:glycoside hydrolase family 127 protein [Acidimicrobiia bacterium]
MEIRGGTAPIPPLHPLELEDVRVEDAFWSSRQALVAEAMLPHQWGQLTTRGYLDNFRAVAPGGDRSHRGMLFADSDLYKWLEAAAYAAAVAADAALETRTAEAVDLIGRAQLGDGYLNTYHQACGATRRWTAPLVDHELYCAGHLIEAACAQDEARGERGLLDVAVRFADHIGERFATPEAGVPGHEEIGIALVRLAGRTGRHEYVELARDLVERRGHVNRYPGAFLGNTTRALRTALAARRRQRPAVTGSDAADDADFGFDPGPARLWPRIAGQFLTGAYFQDRVPLAAQDVAEGHAVRAAYYYAGAGDVALAMQDRELARHLASVWERTTTRRAYVTGALGSLPLVEGFGHDWELPNRAYAETCAAIGGVLWSWRVLRATGSSRAADWIDRALYNAVLSGTSLDGRRYFYRNPLVSHAQEERRPWYGVACCPPNIARTLASVQRYIYTRTEDGVQIHQWIGSRARVETRDSVVSLSLESGLPRDGVVRVGVTATPASELCISLRVPDWAEAHVCRVNGTRVTVEPGDTGYLDLAGTWRDDTIELGFTFTPRPVTSPPQVVENRGRVALGHGPLVHCVQCSDNPGVDVHALRVAGAPETGGEVAGATGLLISTRGGGAPVVATPFFTWGNAGPTDMAVWLCC